MIDQDKQNSIIILPALRAHMGDWIYYISFMKMKDIAKRISYAEEIHKNTSLKELIQRQLSNRAKDIKKYLETQPQRFFSAIVIAVYGGSPSWYEIDFTGNSDITTEQIPSYIEGAIGLLTLQGEEKLFAIDGQHRVVGIRKAIQDNEDLGNEEVSTIFVSHKNSEEGLERTRRLFTTLNRYAKPVNKYDTIALDEDDTVAIVTRRLIDEYPLFTNQKISSGASKSISVTDEYSFTTIVALYDSMDIFLKDRSASSWKQFKKYRPNSEEIENFYEKAKILWDKMCSQFSPLKEMKNSNVEDKVAIKYRNSQKGGNLLFRPIGIQLIISVIRKLVDSGDSLNNSIKKISNVPMSLLDYPWNGLLWDNINKRMLTSSTNRKVGERLVFYSIGGNLSQYKTNSTDLAKEFAGIINKDPKEIKLPKYL